MNKPLLPTAAVLAVIAGQVGPAHAVTIYNNFTAWEAATGVAGSTASATTTDNGTPTNATPRTGVTSINLTGGTVLTITTEPLSGGTTTGSSWWTDWDPTINSGNDSGGALTVYKSEQVTGNSTIEGTVSGGKGTGTGFFVEPTAAVQNSFDNGLQLTITLTNGVTALADEAVVASYGDPAFIGWTGQYVSAFTLHSNTLGGCTRAGHDGFSGSGHCQATYGIGFFSESNDNPAPEPASLALLGSGIVGLGLARRRRKAK